MGTFGLASTGAQPLLTGIFQKLDKGQAREGLTYGWQRATVLGSFFNCVFLLGLGFSIMLMSIARFVDVQRTGNTPLPHP